MLNAGPHKILGVAVQAVDYDYAVEQIITAAQRKKGYTVSALAVHGVMTGLLNLTHRYRLNQLDLGVPDGQPVRWALRWLYGIHLPDRVYGPTLMLKVCAAAAAAGLPIGLYGGDAELLERLQVALLVRFPTLRISYAHPSFFRSLTSSEVRAIQAEIQTSGAALVFVGLGCPRQEVWIYENKQALGLPLIAVGAAFAIHAGIVRQAPAWMQQSGLEWLFRLLIEPRRLWQRYLLLNPLYLSGLLLQKMGLWRFAASPTPPTSEVRYG